MEDQSSRQHTVLTILVAILCAAVIAQSVILLGINRKLTSSEEKLATRPAITSEEKNSPTPPSTPSPRGPFQWGGDKDPSGWELNKWDPFRPNLTRAGRARSCGRKGGADDSAGP